jgi:hypothetical protein
MHIQNSNIQNSYIHMSQQHRPSTANQFEFEQHHHHHRHHYSSPAPFVQQTINPNHHQYEPNEYDPSYHEPPAQQPVTSATTPPQTQQHQSHHHHHHYTHHHHYHHQLHHHQHHHYRRHHYYHHHHPRQQNHNDDSIRLPQRPSTSTLSSTSSSSRWKHTERDCPGSMSHSSASICLLCGLNFHLLNPTSSSYSSAPIVPGIDSTIVAAIGSSTFTLRPTLLFGSSSSSLSPPSSPPSSLSSAAFLSPSSPASPLPSSFLDRCQSLLDRSPSSSNNSVTQQRVAPKTEFDGYNSILRAVEAKLDLNKAALNFCLSLYKQGLYSEDEILISRIRQLHKQIYNGILGAHQLFHVAAKDADSLER